MWIHSPQSMREYRRPFAAKITARSEPESGGVLYRYAWEELMIDPGTGSLVSPPLKRTGTASVSPAYEASNKRVSANTIVWMRMRGMRLGEPVFEFIAPNGSIEEQSGGQVQSGGEIVYDTSDSITVLTRVCPTIVDGVVTEVVNERRLLIVAGGVGYTGTLCASDPANCCPGTVTVTDCCWPQADGTEISTQDIDWPETLYAVPLLAYQAFNFEDIWNLYPIAMTYDGVEFTATRSHSGTPADTPVAGDFIIGDISYDFTLTECGSLAFTLGYGWSPSPFGNPSPSGWVRYYGVGLGTSRYPSRYNFLPDLYDRVYFEVGAVLSPAVCTGDGRDVIVTSQAKAFQTPPPFTYVSADRQLPSTLTLTLTNISGAANLAGTYTLSYDRGFYAYEGTKCGEWFWIGLHIPTTTGLAPSLFMHKQNPSATPGRFEPCGYGSVAIPSIDSVNPLQMSSSIFQFFDITNTCVTTSFPGGPPYVWTGLLSLTITE